MSTAPTDTARQSSMDGMSLLSNGVPLSLLLDLAFGPHSEEVFAVEVPSQREPRS